jgi:hypothetical protein
VAQAHGDTSLSCPVGIWGSSPSFVLLLLLLLGRPDLSSQMRGISWPSILTLGRHPHARSSLPGRDWRRSGPLVLVTQKAGYELPGHREL